MTIAVEVEDVLWGMTSFEKKEMFEELLSELDINWIMECLKDANISSKLSKSVDKNSEEEFNKKILSLINNSFKLTQEEEDLISKISDRINP
jgi:predicted small metal-binding protein